MDEMSVNFFAVTVGTEETAVNCRKNGGNLSFFRFLGGGCIGIERVQQPCV